MTITAAINVEVTVSKAADGSFSVGCASPITLAKGQGPTALTFFLIQHHTSGWRFPHTRSARAGEDYYYGITIFGDDDAEFHDPMRESDIQVCIIDSNQNRATTPYTYAVSIENPIEKRVLTADPTIVNQGE